MVFVKTPYLQLPENDGITVMWETDQLSDSELIIWDTFCPDCGDEHGDAQYIPIGNPRIFTGEAAYVHKVKAVELESGKDYCYRVLSRAADTELTSELCVFRTQSQNYDTFSFAVTSETGGSGSPPPVIDKVVTAIAAERPDFILFVGDMVLDGTQKKDWDDFMFTPFRNLLCHTPFYHCAGNHEENADYMRMFLATSEKGYYDFTYGCAHFIALDSTQLSEHIKGENGCLTIELTRPLSADNAQVKFLIDCLKKSSSQWKFVYLHYPPYFSGTWEGKALRPLCRIFEMYDVDMVFTSHAIVYERSHPIREDSVDFSKGVRYIVAGGAGEQPKWFHHKKAWHTAKSRAVPHFVHIGVTPSYLEFQAIDLDGRVFDSLMIQKQ